MSPKNALQILIWGTFFRSKQGKLSWFAFEVCIPDWYCTASRSGQGKLSWFLSLKKKKTQKSKHLQTVIPNVLQELATDTDLSKTSAGVHRRLCYPMCYAFAGDLCRSPLTMMISSTETELSKTSSRISLVQCWTALAWRHCQTRVMCTAGTAAGPPGTSSKNHRLECPDCSAYCDKHSNAVMF